MEENDLIQGYKDSIKASIEFFSNKNKGHRERWVAKEFLSNLGVKFLEDEITLEADEPPDVLYKDAKFEVKTLLDEGRKMHAEYKNKLKESEAVKEYSDLFESYTPGEITIEEIIKKVLEEIEKIPYSLEVKKELDLLFYINYLHRSIVSDFSSQINVMEEFAKWRSVSFVMNNGLSMVIWANEKAPSFIKLLKGKHVVKERGV